MKLVFDGVFDVSIGEIQGGKTLVVRDPNGFEVQIAFSNVNAELVGKTLANTGIVVPQGKDIGNLVKSAH